MNLLIQPTALASEVDYTPVMDPAGLLSEVYVDYHTYECSGLCTPTGCRGHDTDIPVAITIGGVTFHVDGAQSGDFPSDKESAERVCSVVTALQNLLKP